MQCKCSLPSRFHLGTGQWGDFPGWHHPEEPCLHPTEPHACAQASVPIDSHLQRWGEGEKGNHISGRCVLLSYQWSVCSNFNTSTKALLRRPWFVIQPDEYGVRLINTCISPFSGLSAGFDATMVDLLNGGNTVANMREAAASAASERLRATSLGQPEDIYEVHEGI